MTVTEPAAAAVRAAAVGDLKRVRVAGRRGSLAEQSFRRAWARLVRGDDPAVVAHAETAAVLAATRLGGIDAAVLASGGLDAAAVAAVLAAAFDQAAEGLDPTRAAALRTALTTPVPADPAPAPDAAGLPPFVGLLAAQPRAGATAPGKGRRIVEPPESHADHCLAVAVIGVLLADGYGADPARVFVAGLAHHLHNAVLPDAGFAGEVLLGPLLGPVFRRLTAAQLETLPPGLAEVVRDALALPAAPADTPGSRAFHAADVLDRVLQQRHHARAAAFTLDEALGEMELVHEGPVQAFSLGVLADAGLWPPGAEA